MTTAKDIMSTDFPRWAEIADVLDGPDQEVVQDFVTNPVHGGKVTCHACGRFIPVGCDVGYWDHQHSDEFPHVHFHKRCYNQYEHYYGLDKPID